MFDTKVALIVRNDLATWQRLNVAAFLASGIASCAPDTVGQPYRDANGVEYGRTLVQPVLIFEAELAQLQTVHAKALARELTIIPYVFPMFSTGNDEDNRAVFLAEDPNAINWVGLGLRGPKNAIDKVIKGLKLHG